VLTAKNLLGEISDLWEKGSFPSKSILAVPHNIEEAILLDDRIVILGTNPRRIRGEVRVDMARPRDKNGPRFRALTDHVSTVMTNAEAAVEETLAATAKPSKRFPLLATNGVRYATAYDREILDLFTCIRNHTELDRAGWLLAVNHPRHLRSAQEMTTLFRDVRRTTENTMKLSSHLLFESSDLGISEQTFYRWKSKYAGLEVNQVRQMAQLQEENQRLPQLPDPEQARPDDLRRTYIEALRAADRNDIQPPLAFARM
jgi:hypothetical protein